VATARRRRAPRTAANVRREQLVRAAVDAFAKHGYQGVELSTVAAEVGVTRNLIHHYFPGGKAELYLDAVRVACSELAQVLDISADVPLERKQSANTAAYVDELLGPSPNYILYARASHSSDPAVREAAMAFREHLIRGMAFNHLGTERPSKRLRAALAGYVAFVEATADQWREQKLRDRGALEQLLADVLVATVGATAPRKS